MNQRKGVFSLFPLFVLFLSVLPALWGEETVHVVEKGETIYSLARLYRVSPEELMGYNHIADPSRLQIGKQLRIPPKGGFIERRVLKNETLYGIARSSGIGVEALRDANGFGTDHVLKEGELIRIPQSPAAIANSTTGSTVTGNSGVTAAGKTVAENTGTGGNTRNTQGSAGGVPLVDPRSTALKTVDASLRWPVNPKGIAYMTGKLSGVVVEGEQTESVRSLTRGTVVSAGPYRGFGRVAIVQVTGGYLYVYGGCESLSVKEGDRVGSGTELGKLGVDAVSQKPQLFFLVYRNNNPIDPSKAPRA
ncbi:MAG: LysM peptidoglycan-binding domain-containing protein [Treponema sp.]|jgi:murein DD-endopeptidase MepM/ murein hydrolase activator NlpD|nr:LysM peptidoglycan-binding domain-containing protein [Treponema sp.]